MKLKVLLGIAALIIPGGMVALALYAAWKRYRKQPVTRPV